MQTITTVGLDIAKTAFRLDIAKTAFQVHAIDAAGNIIVRRQLNRRYVLAFFQKLSPCVVVPVEEPSTASDSVVWSLVSSY